MNCKFYLTMAASRLSLLSSVDSCLLNIETLLATLPGAWRHTVSARTAWPSISTLRLSEIVGAAASCLSISVSEIRFRTHVRPRWRSGKASTSRAEDPRFESSLRRDFFGLSHTSDLRIVTPVATLPGAWCYRVSAGTGRPSVSIL